MFGATRALSITRATTHRFTVAIFVGDAASGQSFKGRAVVAPITRADQPDLHYITSYLLNYTY